MLSLSGLISQPVIATMLCMAKRKTRAGLKILGGLLCLLVLATLNIFPPKDSYCRKNSFLSLACQLAAERGRQTSTGILAAEPAEKCLTEADTDGTEPAILAPLHML